MTAMSTSTGTGISVHSVFLPHEDPEASLTFYRDVLGFEVRGDVGYGELRWITVGPPGGAGPSVVLEPPSADPGRTPEEVRTVTAMMAKGTFAGLLLAADDLDATFERLVAAGADVVQEPVQQDWGVRDCAVRDPAGNLLRVQERPA